MPKLNITWYQAEALGIVVCECGCRVNNHFSHGSRKCAFCECTRLVREIVLPPRSPEKGKVSSRGE